MANQTISLLIGDVTSITPESVGTFDAILSDPPYGLKFLGEDWDAPWKKYTDCQETKNREMLLFQKWCEQWATVLFSVMKSGGLALFFGGTRTHHRMSCGVEDAGFVIRDELAWLQGQGFPKNHDVSKAIDREAGATREVVGPSPNNRPAKVKGGAGFDKSIGEQRGTYPKKTGSWSMATEEANETAGERIDIELTLPATPEAQQWNGYGSALKPSHEPILLCQAPLNGTIASNCIKYGCGALNIDGCRIGSEQHVINKTEEWTGFGQVKNPQYATTTTSGRWPANVVLSHLPECRQVGTKKVLGSTGTAGGRMAGKQSAVYGGYTKGSERAGERTGYTEEDGTETVEAWECAPGCPVVILDEQSEHSGVHPAGSERSGVNQSGNYNASSYKFGGNSFRFGDKGSASRFFYCAKADNAERNLGLSDQRCNHPTVKPLDLCTYLAKLLLPPPRTDGQSRRILVPFAGVGSEMIGALRAGWDEVVGIELSQEYTDIARKRIEGDQPLFYRVEVRRFP